MVVNRDLCQQSDNVVIVPKGACHAIGHDRLHEADHALSARHIWFAISAVHVEQLGPLLRPATIQIARRPTASPEEPIIWVVISHLVYSPRMTDALRAFIDAVIVPALVKRLTTTQPPPVPPAPESPAG